MIALYVWVKDNRGGEEEEHSEDKEGQERGGQERRDDGETEPGKGGGESGKREVSQVIQWPFHSMSKGPR